MLNNKKEPVLFLHAGGPKTGSSALQSFLEINSEKLEGLGISYNNKAGVSFEYQISSGNGAFLFEALSKFHLNVAYIDEVVKSYFNDTSVAICSKEQFGDLSSEQWRALAAVCESAGIRLHVIFYVRNVIPFIKSSYDQLIKRHGLNEDFDKWVETTEWSHARALRAMAEAIAPEAITVIGYDANKERVVDSFVELIGARSLKATSNPIVNRSLTRLERELLRKVNRHTGSVFSTELSDRMIYANPHALSESIEVGEHVEDLLEQRYKEDIDWINRTFFEREPVVALGRQARRSVDARDLALPEVSAADRAHEDVHVSHELVLDWALEKLSGARDSGIHQVAGALSRIDWHLADDPSLPTDFDAIAYLLKNPDLIAAGVPPFMHYVNYGRNEAGRTWTWEGAALPDAKNEILRKEQSLREREERLEQEHASLEQERARMEAEFAQLKMDSRMEVESLLRQLANREKEHGEQLLASRAAIDHERAAFSDAAAKKLAEIANAHEVHVQALERDLAALRGDLDQLRRETESQLRKEIAREQQFAEQLNRDRGAFDQERMALLDASDRKLAEAAEYQARYATERESEVSSLRSQLTEQRENAEMLLRKMVEIEQKSIRVLSTELATMRATLGWRLTAPLRRLSTALKRN
ncbi:hypothetical protein [Paraburkholderia bannensis]|uniref:hypothetical protein n=1 Tax=Paraburkholderia bannensis TaxID=765414 RepID=UPI002AB734B3|nr:hypothetical protein [Paraburkholderia bannensis]